MKILQSRKEYYGAEKRAERRTRRRKIKAITEDLKLIGSIFGVLAMMLILSIDWTELIF